MMTNTGNTYSFRTFEETDMTPEARTALAEKIGGSGASNGSTRRDFFKSAGIMVVGFTAVGQATRLGAQSPINPTGLIDATKVDSWVSIGADESVTVYSGKCEFGQGFATVQLQLAAEELNVPLSRVKLIFCDTGFTPDQGTTSGSQSHIAEFGPGGLRQALDTARDALLNLAAQWFDTTADQLTVTNGVVSPKADATQQITYGQLLQGERFNLVLSSTTVPKDPKTYTVLGTSVPRPEVPAKATGTFRYVHTIKVPGMLHGRVVRPPTVGAKVVSVDQNSVANLPGNVQVVVKNNFVGVVADSQWHAVQAAGALRVTWSAGDTLPDQATLYTTMQTLPSADSLTIDTGDTDAQLAGAARTFSAQYLHPFQMHGALAASCSVADVRGGTGAKAIAKIWSATQGVYPQRDSVALVLGIPKENVRVIFAESSGCYGLNGNDSVSYDAAILSQAVGKPVRVQWSRRDEHSQGESYGPAYVINLQAGVDVNGALTVWNYEAWTLSKGNRPNATTPGNIISGNLAGFPAPVPTPAKATPPTTFSNNGNSVFNYSVGIVAGKSPAGTGNVNSAKVLTHTVASPFFTGPLRSPARLQNTFANESFMDEIASALRQDPIEYRVRHLSDPRLIAVLRAAQQAALWDTRPSPKGQIPFGPLAGRGVSCVLYEGNNGYSAMIAHVEVDYNTGVVTVKSMTGAVESGPVSNPDGIINQTEGGYLQGMSRAMYEQVKWNSKAGIVTSTDWNTYPVFQWGQPVPQVKVVVINNPNVSQTGAGELGITLSASAIGNAIFDAIGVRVRQIPFTPANVLAAIAASTTK
jgi:CO/xanthine dehydrogenase Mo-binding subunit